MASCCDLNEVTVGCGRESIVATLVTYVDSRVCDVRSNRNGPPLSKIFPQLFNAISQHLTDSISLIPTANAIDAFIHIFSTPVPTLLAEAVRPETPLANTLSMGLSSHNMMTNGSWVLHPAAYEAAESTTRSKTSGTHLSEEYVVSLVRLTANGNISSLHCGLESVLTRSPTEVGILRGEGEGRKNPGVSGRTHQVVLLGVSSDLEFASKIASVEDFMMGKMVKCIPGNGSDTCTAIDGCTSTLGAAAAQRGNRAEVNGFPGLHDTGWNEDAVDYGAARTKSSLWTKTGLPLVMSSLILPVKAEGVVIVPTTTSHTGYVVVVVAVVAGAIAIVYFIVVSKLKARARALEMQHIDRCLEDVPSTTGRRREDENDIPPSLNF
ncbi:uncharacterized protein [Physcomitrium patens]|uniref:Transmembrane protein n=1 Tax=Physcomitrium patens TaxID=3218 RepID=A0A2K1L3Q7_PHYPA|nr:uncharacterized protein LOC112294407 [Physcomitrium patens]PNR60651.1 hypothetical protein PHYPA_003444 [Physcomitrium patens]|eukprot:XP_024400533.1 uncharacterized protein LOC112294407 [Physcomitrella patens]